MQKNKSKNQAFTLIEILVVATIIGILVTVAAVSFANSQKRSRNARRKADLETVRQALVLYRQDHGSYGDVAGGFPTVVNNLSAGGYLTTNDIADPKTGNPAYSLICLNGASSDCNKVQLTASLENEVPATYVVSTP